MNVTASCAVNQPCRTKRHLSQMSSTASSTSDKRDINSPVPLGDLVARMGSVRDCARASSCPPLFSTAWERVSRASTDPVTTVDNSRSDIDGSELEADTSGFRALKICVVAGVSLPGSDGVVKSSGLLAEDRWRPLAPPETPSKASCRARWRSSFRVHRGGFLCFGFLRSVSNMHSRCSRLHFAHGGKSVKIHLTFRARHETHATYVRVVRCGSDTDCDWRLMWSI